MIYNEPRISDKKNDSFPFNRLPFHLTDEQITGTPRDLTDVLLNESDIQSRAAGYGNAVWTAQAFSIRY